MHTLPFQDVEAAKTSAEELQESLAFFEIQDPRSGAAIRRQHTQHLLAQAFGCQGWVDLCGRLNGTHRVQYYAPANCLELSLAPYNALARDFAFFLQAGASVEARLCQALQRCALGCHPRVREEVLKLRPGVGLTAGQLRKLWEVDAWRSYHGRYDNRRDEYEIRMLDYLADRERAIVLGSKPPAKPRRPTVRQRFG